MRLFRILFTICVFVLFAGHVFAAVMPTYTTTVPKNVYGFLQVGNTFDVHSKPGPDSVVLDSIKWDKDEVLYRKYRLDPTEMFAVLVPEKKYAFLYVMDEEEGWFKVVYDKKNQKMGWVKAKTEEDFWGLKDFYTYFGKKKSLYYLKDVDVQKRSLRSAPSDSSQALQGFNVTKNIKLVLIRGNWALVSIIDYERSVPKTGYIKWRDSDGALYLFPQMN